MPPQPRQRTKLGKGRPGGGSGASDQQVQESDEQISRGRAGDAHARPRDAGDAHARPRDAGDAHARPRDAGDAHARSRDAGDARMSAQNAGARDAGVDSAGSANTSAQHPESEITGARGASPERTAPDSAEERASEDVAGGRPSGASRRVQWTADAKALRAELAAWSAARRKVAEREGEVRRLIESGRVPVDDARAIVVRAAEATGDPVDEVARAAGLDRTTFKR